jgi:hypothetical protein
VGTRLGSGTLSGPWDAACHVIVMTTHHFGIELLSRVAVVVVLSPDPNPGDETTIVVVYSTVSHDNHV